MKYLDKFYKFLQNLEKRRNIVFIALALVCVCPAYIIGRWSMPAFDDFSYSILVKHSLDAGAGFLGVLNAAVDTVVNYYYSWQGTYSASFIMALQPGVFGSKYSFWGPFLLITALLIGISRLIFSVCKAIDIDAKGCIATLCVLIWFYFIQCLPSATEGFYWFNGGSYYTLFSAVVALNIALALRCMKKGGLWIGIICLPLSFLISGGNQVSAFLNIVLLAFLFAVAVKNKSKGASVLLFICFAAAVAGFVITLTAPGTMIRAGGLARQNILITMIFGLYRFFIVSYQYITPSFIAFICLISPMLYGLAKKMPKISLWHIFTGTVLFLICVCGMICIPFFAMGNWGDGRLQNAIFYTWNIGVIMLYTLILAYAVQNVKISAFPRPIYDFVSKTKVLWGSLIIIFVFLMGNFAVPGTGARALREMIAGTPMKLHSQYENRTQLAMNGVCRYNAFSATDTMLYMGDLSTDKSLWTNAAFAAYYNLPEVEII